MAGVDRQIADLNRKLEALKKEVGEKEYEFAKVACSQIETDCHLLMRDTETDSSIAYGTKRHHPSVPGSAPAIDTGTLTQSIKSEVVKEDGEVMGYVGSTLKTDPYGMYLEFGTSTIKPRPWLSTAVIKNQSFMREAYNSIVGNAMGGN